MLLHKINLSRTLEMMRQLFPKDYDFYPQTWYLPHQLSDFSTAVKERQRSGNRSRRSDPNQKPTFIVKPDEGSQGDGIYLIREPEEYRVGSKNHVVQEYLVNPLLIDGYKFDLRVYVLVKSIEPLEIYLCKVRLVNTLNEAMFVKWWIKRNIVTHKLLFVQRTISHC